MGGPSPLPVLCSRRRKEESRDCWERGVSVHKGEALGEVHIRGHVIKYIAPCEGQRSGVEVQMLLIPRALWSSLSIEQRDISTPILNPPHLKKNWNTIKGHMSENLIWRLCDEIFSFMKRKCSGFFPIINALVPAKPHLIPSVLECLGITRQR